MFDKAKQLYSLQKKARAVQKELKETEVEAKSQNGSVTVVFNGEQHLLSLEIAPEFLAPEKKKQLEEDLKKTITEAIARVQAMASEKSKDMMKDMGLNIPGM